MNLTQYGTKNTDNEYNISQYLYKNRPVCPVFYKRRTWEKVDRFPKKISNRNQIESLNWVSREKSPEQQWNVDIN